MKDRSKSFLPSNKVVVLIGSGASAGLGYPTTDELTAQTALERLPDKPISNQLLEFAGNIDLFLRTFNGNTSIESAIEHTNFYIEALKGMAIDQNFIAYLIEKKIARSNAGAMLEAAKTVRELFYESLYYIYFARDISREHIEAVQNLTELYIYLASMNGESDNHNSGYLDIFTTNYDTALESIFKANPMINLIDKSFLLSSSHWRPRSKALGDHTINLAMYRLHGCVEWCRTDNVNKDEFVLWKEKPGMRLWSSMAVKVSGKDSEIGHEPFRSAYAEFRRKLAEPGTICVVLGMGFRDRDLAHCIYEALVSKAGCEKLIVMDKSLTQEKIYDRLTKFPGTKKDLLPGQKITVINHAIELAESKELLAKEFQNFRINRAVSRIRTPYSKRRGGSI